MPSIDVGRCRLPSRRGVTGVEVAAGPKCPSMARANVAGMTPYPPGIRAFKIPGAVHPLTARTSRVIGGRAPSDYLERLANSAKVDRDTISKHVSTHLADAGVMAQDDFGPFFA